MTITRPASVTITGWLTVASGALAVISSAMVFVVLRFMPLVQEFPRDPDLVVPYWLLEHLAAIAIVQLALAISAIVAGVGFLRLQSWARAYIEVLAWVFLFGTVGFGVIWLRSAVSFSNRLHDTAAAVPAGFPASLVGAGVIAMLIILFPLVLVIRELRSPAVREAMGSSAHASAGV